MLRRVVPWMVLVSLCCPALARADDASGADATGLEALSQGLRALQAHRSTVEHVYLLALGVEGDDGTSNTSPANAQAKKLLSSQSSADGLVTTRPDLAAFEALAKQYGTSTDVAFFQLLRRTYSDASRRVYVVATGPDTHCTDFTPRVIVPLYGEWLKFAKKHSDAYFEPAQREIAAIEHAMMSEKCACSSQKTVSETLRAFIHAYPKGNVTPEVEGRLDQIRARRPDFSFNCQG